MDLAQRAVACKHWRWLPGMTTPGGAVVLRVSDGTPLWCVEPPWYGDALPDLHSPATLGCFEHGLIPDAWGPECTIALDLDVYGSGGWGAKLEVWEASRLSNQTRVFEADGETRVEAVAKVLVAALEAAP